ncbi:hypothetical protein A0H81_08070 [Grifola frondosa]|uniref:Uncharacterized protein n=1 Tax=Grifola frondosa TaxID=5627 RepID=A0A1C7M701_GRIFR|nr:hypothetical protein A0H81_08070 [Grifola frondosa]
MDYGIHTNGPIADGKDYDTQNGMVDCLNIPQAAWTKHMPSETSLTIHLVPSMERPATSQPRHHSRHGKTYRPSPPGIPS